MGFNAQAFSTSHLTPRTEDVPVKVLAQWFGEGEEPIWRVRGLTANELAKARDAKAKQNREAALVEALQSGNKEEIIKEVKTVIGRDDSTEPDTAWRLELLAMGSVEPECSVQLAVKLGEAFPIPFMDLTNRIINLSGQGQEAKKKP